MLMCKHTGAELLQHQPAGAGQQAHLRAPGGAQAKRGALKFHLFGTPFQETARLALMLLTEVPA